MKFKEQRSWLEAGAVRLSAIMEKQVLQPLHMTRSLAADRDSVFRPPRAHGSTRSDEASVGEPDLHKDRQCGIFTFCCLHYLGQTI